MSRSQILTASTLAIAVLSFVATVIYLGRDGGERRSPGDSRAEAEISLSSADAVSDPDPGSSITRRDAVICGVVVAVGGIQRPAALVALRGPTGSITTRTDEGGSYCFRALTPGSYDLAARDGALRSETVEGLVLGPGEEVRDLALVVRGGTAVSGRVVNRLTGEGVAEARVAAHCGAGLGLSSSVSSSDGEFSLEGVPEGRHSLSVKAPGFSSGELVLEVVGRRPLRGVTVVMDPAARIRGKVVGPAGKAISGALVRAEGYRLRERPEALRVRGDGAAHTDRDGMFDVEAPVGLVTLLAEASGHGPGRTTAIEVRPGASVDGVVVRLGEAAGLMVDVLDVGGRPAQGAVVRVTCEGGVLCGSDVADTAGRVVMSDLSEGTARLEAVASDRRGRAQLSVRLSGGVRRHLTLALSEEGVVSGMVVDERGDEVAGATVIVRDDSESRVGETVTDADGRFNLSIPGAVSVSLRAEAGGRTAERSGVRAGDQVILSVAATGSVFGYVIDDAGRPVTDFTVTMTSREGVAGPGVWRKERFASVTGDFSLSGLAPGGYAISASGAEYAAGDESAIRVWAGDETGPIRLALSAAGRIEGLVSSPDGSPIAGVRVALEPAKLRGLARWIGAPGTAVETDPAGRFLLHGVPAGSHRRVYAWHPEWSAGAAEPVMVEAGRTAGPVEITLRSRQRPGPSLDESFGGVGMTIGNDSYGHVRVGEVYPGGPAFLAGVRESDRILSIDGTAADPLGLRGALTAIRGPIGTEVTLVLEREDGSRFSARMVRVELRM